MSGAKGPLLLVAGGCAAMLGAAALTVSLGSFFADLPTTKANAAVVAELPVKKVKTVSLKPVPVEAAAASAPDSRPQPAAKPTPVEQPAVVAAADEEELHQADPRWARSTEPPRETPDDGDKLEAAFAAQTEGSSAGSAAAQELERRSGEQVAALTTTDDGADAAEVAPVVQDEPAQAPKKRVPQNDIEAQEPARVDGRTVTINSGVNLRSSGRSGSKVIGTVPTGARVTLSSDCRDWCRVTYNGRTGYVWRQFVNGAGVSKARTRRANRQTEHQAPVEAANSEPGLFGNDGVINNDGAAGSARARAGAAQAAAAAAAKKPEKPAFVPPDR